MNTLTFKLSAVGSQLWHTRDGEKSRRALTKVLDKSSPGDLVVIDCKGVDVFDVSFAGAFFARTIAALPMDYPERSLVVTGLNDTTRANLEPCLKEAGLMLAELVGKKAQLRGKFSPSDEQTLEFMMGKKQPLTVRELADMLSINATAANERLSKLAKMAILQRQTAPSGRTQQLFVAPAI